MYLVQLQGFSVEKAFKEVESSLRDKVSKLQEALQNAYEEAHFLRLKTRQVVLFNQFGRIAASVEIAETDECR